MRATSALLLAIAHAIVLVSCALAPARALDSTPEGVWPLQPRPEVVSGFRPPEVVWGRGHRGVDLLGRPGQVVHAALAGTVTFAGSIAGRGVVVVDHGQTRTTYEPVEASVRAGDPVGRGAGVGRLVQSDSHCLPRTCLHWGWLRGRTYLNPLDLVGAGPVRLLPLWRDAPVEPGPTAWLRWVTTTQDALRLLPYAALVPVSPLRPLRLAGEPAGRRDAASRS